MILSSLKNDFPIFKNQKDLVYLDSAATSLKPQIVIDAVSDYYSTYSANVARGLYPIAEKATIEFENAREKVAKFINAKKSEEIIFTRGTTEAINLVAYSWGRTNIERNDEIVTTIMEHHSNFVPWQQLAGENGGILKVIDITEDGTLDIFEKSSKFKVQSSKQIQISKSKLHQIITKKTKLVALAHVSNVLGTINPIKEIVAEVKRINPRTIVIVDGAQAVPHMKVDVQDLGCDFYVFSGHKMLGPTGIGVLWGKYELLDEMPPFNFGSSMIDQVTLSQTTFRKPPIKFESGTPHIAGVIGLGAAIGYINKIGIEEIRNHEAELTGYALEYLNNLNYLSMYGPYNKEKRAGVISFNIFTADKKLIHPHDVADILARDNVCVRAGHHCTMPLQNRLGVPGSVRVSLNLYNTKEDVDRLVKGIGKVRGVFK